MLRFPQQFTRTHRVCFWPLLVLRTFKELEAVYEVISPDAFLRPYIDDYAMLADIYQTVYSYFDPKAQQRRLSR